MQYSQEHLKTMVYAQFGGQTECIMGNSKIENMFALLEIGRVCKALKLFVDLQGPICYKDPKNKGMNLIVS